MICLPLLGSVGSAQETNAPANSAAASSAPDDVRSLREEVRQLRDELNAVKNAASTNAATLKSVSDKVKDAATQSDLEALRDIEDENTLRSIGSSSSLSSYTVNGNQHLVNLTGFGQLGYQAYLNPNQATTGESFRLALISLSLSGTLRNNAGAEGDVRYNLGVIGSPTKYNGAANTSEVSANNSAATVNGSTANGSFLNASDVWISYDVKTTKLELEPAWTMTLQLGQFLTPYGIENISTENNRPTINQAQYISRLGFGRDIGFEAVGGLIQRNDPSATTVPLIAYTVGVFNGSGANSFDANNGVDALLRLQYNPFYQFAENFRNLSFGVNILEGNLGPKSGELPTKRRVGGDIQWLRKPFLLTAEYVHSVDGYNGSNVNPPGDGGAAGATPTASFARSDSIVTTLFWTPATLPDFQPWTRFDRLVPTAYNNLTAAQLLTANTGGTGNYGRNAYSIGFNWFFWQVNPVTTRAYASAKTERVLKLQLGYTFLQQPGFTMAPNTTTTTGNRSQIDALLTYNF